MPEHPALCRSRFSAALCALLLGASLAGSGCATMSSAWTVGATQMESRDSLRRVKGEPPTPAFVRLKALAERYPGLSLFLQGRGYPDFIFETSHDGRDYFVLHYVQKTGESYLFRTMGPFSQHIEAGGRVPMDKKELAFFKAALDLEKGD